MTSTVVNSTLIQSSDVCSNKWLTLASGSTRVKMTAAQCRSRRGGFINRDDVPAASSDALSTLSNLNPGWVNITKEDTDTPFQYAVETDLRMQDQSVTMLQGLISEGQQHTMSHIGLAETSTLLQSLKDAKLIRAKSWGLDAGSQSFTAPRNGSLVLGGYDASSIGEGWFSYEIPKSNLVRERSCPLQVQITQMELDVQVGQNKIPVERPVTGGSPLAACIEPYDNQFRFPTSILDNIKRMLGGDSALVNPSQYPNIYSVEPGLVYNSSANISFSMTLTIENGLTVEIPSHELVRPLRGLDTGGVPIVNSSLTEVQVFAQEGPLEGPVLGKVFLSQVLYLFVNHENSTFSLARQNLGQTFLDVKSSGSCPSVPASTKTDKGLIAVGVVLGFLIIGLICYTIYRCCKAPWVTNNPDPEIEQIQPPGHPNFLEIPTPPRPSVEES
ncbi:uncharacterized protein FRV6_02677 [Fusarium oxysporum]|uniref:Peptidase A1 domain-containing protein n=1 Tax=Fusarium oxysporum TaxID=5507 RepID=A0A2H3T1A6_FUSOX|nr:uncharacterized protein FRV6_02677 [Fusarium oxysporum]